MLWFLFLIAGWPHLRTLPDKEQRRDVTLSIVAGGDVMFGRFIKGRMARIRTPGETNPLAAVRPIVSRADFALCNLETPVTRRTYHVRRSTIFIFRAEPRVLEWVRRAGFSMVITANNHALDQRGRGLVDTLQLVGRHGLLWAGTGHTRQQAAGPVVTTVRGVPVAVVAATLIMNTRRRPRQGAVHYLRWRRAMTVLPRLVRAARAKARIVVVSLHWGYEYVHHPSRGQRLLAKRLAAAGADVVFGHHPHVLQGIEHTGRTVVFYSLGNLLFDSSFGDTKESGLARVTFSIRGSERRIARVEFLPLLRNRRGIPQVPSRRGARRILRHLVRYSRRFSKTTRFRVTEDRLLVSSRKPVHAWHEAAATTRPLHGPARARRTAEPTESTAVPRVGSARRSARSRRTSEQRP